MSDDLHLGYSPGCGGFLLLHLLLLTGKYKCSIMPDLDQIIKSQWVGADKWKSTEVWPDNEKTNKLTGNRLFFYLAPSRAQWDTITDNKLFIYANYDTQLSLCEFKGAGWYHQDVAPSQRTLEFHMLNHYNSVKGLDWPLCTSYTDLKTLSSSVLAELLSDSIFAQMYNATSWKEWQGSVNTELFEHAQVFKDISNILHTSTNTVCLSDLVFSTKSTFNKLGLEPTPAHFSLIDKWKSLHPAYLLDKLKSGSCGI